MNANEIAKAITLGYNNGTLLPNDLAKINYIIRELAQNDTAQNKLTSTDFKLNQAVSFGKPNGQQRTGVVVKINRKSVKIKVGPEFGGQIWGVSPDLITVV